MSSETRTLLVVLAICAFVALMCLIVPLGIGAVLYFRVQQQQVAVQAEFNQALAEQQRMQADAARRQAEMQQQIEAQLNAIPPIGLPPGLADEGPTPGGAALDEQQRRTIYFAVKQVKQLDALFAEVNAAVADDPNMQQAAAEMKRQKENALRQLAAQFNVTPAQLDEIAAEGDKAGW